jgi:hypothetical protein
MTTVPAKQSIKFMSAPVRMNGISVSGSSADISTAIATALSTAGDGGVSVPTQVLGGTNKIGVLTTAPSNRCKIYAALSDGEIVANDERVYGRLTESGGVYTIAFYRFTNAGVETAYSFASATNIDIEFNYRFDWHRLPADAIIAIESRDIAQDSSGSGQKVFRERLTIATQNVIPDLTKTPDQNYNVTFIINGLVYSSIGGSAPFSISGKTATWSVANAGFNLDTTDRIDASYTTLE